MLNAFLKLIIFYQSVLNSSQENHKDLLIESLNYLVSLLFGKRKIIFDVDRMVVVDSNNERVKLACVNW